VSEVVPRSTLTLPGPTAMLGTGSQRRAGAGECNVSAAQVPGGDDVESHRHRGRARLATRRGFLPIVIGVIAGRIRAKLRLDVDRSRQPARRMPPGAPGHRR
jgi:hypothetical protein